MIPTPTSTFFILLGIFAIFFVAHAEDSSKTILHNEIVLTSESVVQNWTLICEQLCSLNLSGPACGLECVATVIPVNKQNLLLEEEDREEYYFPLEHQSKLCETLCDNELGEKRCECPVSIIPAASSSPRLSRNKICLDFCRFHHVTIRGCSLCSFKILEKSPLRDISSTTATATHIFNISRYSHNFILPTYGSSMSITSVQAPTTEAPSTPDWNLLCASLCRQGSGGILCNCDLAPF